MASFKKTKFLVATGIMICMLGLAFIAVSGSSALSSGYGTHLKQASLEAIGLQTSGRCEARKGSMSCLNQTSTMF
ncbi:hypothetical protein [Cohaesibacter celericrescens]|uniref:Uncharacterized protein n=1 Tax=Cohaesibacter celericrescens TaxID=2067669 RepID=A0A2N5XT05_9HYPH|nr:hypothetical protein [Cohaesibacter celericrescens]PLW77651.1 hypothetical protein C0081_10160 [Cohaesibacter celericrescens]